MKMLTSIAAVVLLASVGACAAGGDQALVTPGQPHAIVSTSLPPGVSRYQVKVVWLDGNYLSSGGNRSTFWVKPGEHEIGFQAIISSRRGGIVMSTPSTSAPQKMRTLKMDLKQGYTYYFAAEIPGSNPSQWRPVLIKKEKSGG